MGRWRAGRWGIRELNARVVSENRATRKVKARCLNMIQKNGQRWLGGGVIKATTKAKAKTFDRTLKEI